MDEESLSKRSLVQLKEMAKDAGLKGYSTLKKSELIDRLIERSKRQSRLSETPSYSSFVDECVKNPLSDVKDMAEALEIESEGKTKQQLCLEIGRELEPDEPRSRTPSPKPRTPSPKPRSKPKSKPRTPSPKPRTSKPKSKPRTPSPKPRTPSPKVAPEESKAYKDCMKKKRPELIAEAIDRGIVVGKKTKAQLCLELTATTACVKKSRPDIVDEAEDLNIDTGGKTKQQICVEIAESPRRKPRTPSPKPRTPKPKSKPRTPSPKLRTPKPKSKPRTPSPKPRTPKPKSKPRTPSPKVAPEESKAYKDCMKKKRPELVAEAIDRGIVVGKKTKAQLCLELTAHHVRTVSLQVSLSGSEEELTNEALLDAIEKLTGVREFISSNALAQRASAANIRKFAKKLGIIGTETKTKFGLAEEIYQAITGPGPLIDDVIRADIPDPVVANELIDSINSSLNEDELNAAIDSITNYTPEAERAVVEEAKRDVAIDVIEQAENDGAISARDADRVLKDIAPSKTTIRLASPLVERRKAPALKVLTAPRVITKERQTTIESMLQELREPQAKISELAAVKSQVFKMLGLM
jgi:hypothetical protein